MVSVDLQTHEFRVDLGDLQLERGPILEKVYLAAWSWGPKDPSAETVLVVHALTGDARVGGEQGWWSPLVGPGKSLDPSQTRILCFNNLGSCYGSFGPSQESWPWIQDPIGGQAVPAPVTTWDQARAILRALDRLEVSSVRVAVGGSLGAMLVLALGALAPDRFRQLIPIAGSLSSSPWIIGFNHVARQAILLDATWQSGGTRGLELARQIAQMTYRAEPGLTDRQGRRMGNRNASAGDFNANWDPGLAYAQQTYLEHHGRKFKDRFDAPSYLLQLAAMDHHDVQRSPPEPTEGDSYQLEPNWSGQERLGMRIDAIGIDTDVLYPEVHMQDLAAQQSQRHYHRLHSIHGHDAFLIEWPQLEAILRVAGAPFSKDSST